MKTADPARFVGNAVDPVADINDPYQPENRCNRGERLWSQGTTRQVTAASFGIGQIFNPVGSGKLSVLKKAILSLSLPTSAVQPGNMSFQVSQFFPVASNLVNTAPFFVRDQRLQVAGTLGVTTGLNFTTSPTAGPNGMFCVSLFPQAAAQPGALFIFDGLDIVFTPGFGSFVGLFSDALATATYTYGLYLEGYERTIDPAELIAPGI